MQKIIDGLFWVLVVAVLLSFRYEQPEITVNLTYALVVTLVASVLIMIISKRINNKDQ